jgi:hypothetical protein
MSAIQPIDGLLTIGLLKLSCMPGPRQQEFAAMAKSAAFGVSPVCIAFGVSYALRA